MSKFIIYIFFLAGLAGAASAQQNSTSGKYEQRLRELIRMEEEQEVTEQQQTSSQAGKKRRTSPPETERAAQIAEVNEWGKDAAEAIVVDRQLQKLLDQTENIELPPLSVFLNAAYENATIKKQEAVIDEKMADYKITQRQWLNYFRVNGSYSYGIFSALTDRSDPETPLFQAYSGVAQHTWNIGAGFSISLGDVFTQRHRRKMKRAQIRQAQYQYDEVVEQRKLMILDAYNKVVEQLATIKAKAESAAMYNAQMKISENEFINGQITLIALSLERARRTGALVTFQECKVQLHNAITLLELLTNIKIIEDSNK